MQKDISIKLKATLLLIVFSMNTVVGFACAMGVDMGYNNSHHEAEATEVAVHVHADGKKHHHDSLLQTISIKKMLPKKMIAVPMK